MELSKDGLDSSASDHSLKDRRACYAEQHRNEQVLQHQELHGYALHVQPDSGIDPSSVRQRTRARRSVHHNIKGQKVSTHILIRQDIVRSLREAFCTGISVHEGSERRR